MPRLAAFVYVRNSNFKPKEYLKTKQFINALSPYQSTCVLTVTQVEILMREYVYRFCYLLQWWVWGFDAFPTSLHRCGRPDPEVYSSSWLLNTLANLPLILQGLIKDRGGPQTMIQVWLSL